MVRQIRWNMNENYKTSYSTKCTWICPPPNGIYFVQGSILELNEVRTNDKHCVSWLETYRTQKTRATCGAKLFGRSVKDRSYMDNSRCLEVADSPKVQSFTIISPTPCTEPQRKISSRADVLMTSGLKHWKRNVVLTEFSSVAAPDVVILTTSGAASDENLVRLTTFPFQWSVKRPRWKWLLLFTIHHTLLVIRSPSRP